VIAYDRLGFGRSDPYPGLLPNDFIRREATTGLAAIRAHLGLGKMILFGHSVGGGMAVSAAAAFPEVTLAIVTESAQAFVEDCTLAGIREAQSAFETPGQIERLERYHDDKARWVLDAWVKTWQRPEFADWTLDDQLLRIHCPVLAMHGDKDEFGSGLHPERISGLPPGLGRIVILENCGHVPHREQPEAVLRAVCEFLAAQD
jgi:pimeloyl-ACP methyl ester carboxylesterase